MNHVSDCGRPVSYLCLEYFSEKFGIFNLETQDTRMHEADTFGCYLNKIDLLIEIVILLNSQS